MLRRKKFYVIYPEYFEKSRSRSQGRRVSRNIASDEPTLKKLIFVCNKLNIEHQVQKDKAYPSNWWNQMGRVLIPIDKEDKIPKEKLLKQIAEITRKIVYKKEPITEKKAKEQTRTPSARKKTKSAKKKSL